MILYLDSSALVKRYTAEEGSAQIAEAISQVEHNGTCIITRPEISAALAKAVRTHALDREEALQSLAAFRKDWDTLARLDVTEVAAARADTLAWEHNLRGYDSVHLACALIWQEEMEESVTLATYDKQLWRVAKRVGLIPFECG